MPYKKTLICFLPLLLSFIDNAWGQLVLTIKTTETICGDVNGSISVTVSNGTPPYTYTLDTRRASNIPIFTDVYTGVHTLLVTDATGATATTQVTITNKGGKPNAGGFLTQSPTCGAMNGIVTLNARDGTPPYTFSIDNVNYQTSPVFTNLPNGYYWLFVKDANGCISDPPNGAWSYVRCPDFQPALPTMIWPDCSNNGSLSMPINGSYPPFTYSIDGINYKTDPVFNNLGPGTYLLRRRDGRGIVDLVSITLRSTCYQPTTVTATMANCGQSNGTITVNSKGNQQPYTYSIDGINYQPGNVFTGLATGYYMIYEKNSFGLINPYMAFVDSDCPVIITQATVETCGSANGSITATGSKGTPPYAYSIDGVSYNSANTFTGLQAGTYTIYLRDATGVVVQASVTVKATCVSVTAVPTNETCNNKNGRIDALGANGTTPYQYSIDGINFQTSNTFTQLAAGNYTITIKDANNTTNSTPVSIGVISGPQLTVNASPSDCNNSVGAIAITGTNGTLPLQYSIDGTHFGNNYQFNNLSSGTYTAFVKDANGCTATDGITVPLINNLVVDAGTDVTICEGVSSTLAAASNGNSLTWAPATVLNNAAVSNPVATPATTTKFYVTAMLGQCTQKDSVTIFVNPAPVAITGAGSTICYGESATLQGSGGISCSWTPVAYLDNPHAYNPTVNKPTSTINYALTVTDGNNCSSIQPAVFTVNVTPPAKVFAGNDTAIISNQPFQLHALDVNNSGFTNFTWSPAFGLSNPAAKDPVAIFNQAVTLTVTASTPAGCAGSDQINIKVYPGPEIYVPNAFTPNGDGKNDVLKTVAVGIKQFHYFMVYNRWGQRVFYSTLPGVGWDGKNIPLQNTNTFVWKAAGTDYKGNLVERKGTVLLIR